MTETRQFPHHFMFATAPYAYNLVEASTDIFRKTEPNSGAKDAFSKTQAQTAASLPGIYDKATNSITDSDINAYLTQDVQASKDYQAFENAYRNLQKLEVIEFPGLNPYINAAQPALKKVDKQFKLFIAAQKKLFNSAYAKSFPDQKIRDELWKKHETNLKAKILAPAEQFAKDTHPDYLLSQAFIDYLDRLHILDKSIASTQHGITRKKYDPKSYFIDSNRKPIHVEHDKKTGKVSEIRVDALSGTFFGISGKPMLGDVGDAWATMVASYAKGVPIKMVFPVSGTSHLNEMDPGLTQGLVLLASWFFQRLEKRFYENSVLEAAKKHGLNMDDVTAVDLGGKPLLSSKLRAQVKEQQEKWESEYTKLRKEEQNPLSEQPTTPTLNV